MPHHKPILKTNYMEKEAIKAEIKYLEMILAITYGTGLTDDGMLRLAELKNNAIS
jgi:hypothetical protein